MFCFIQSQLGNDVLLIVRFTKEPSLLNFTPAPCLSGVFTIFRFIWQTVQQVQASQAQLRTLAVAVAQVLQILGLKYHAGHLIEGNTPSPLGSLHRFSPHIE